MSTTTSSNVCFTTKIGTNHGKARSRIWIEGTRLVAAGFTVGTFYQRTLSAGTVRITLTKHPEGRYKVAGKGDKPIIDLTGAIVAECFPEPLTHVHVRFAEGVITIAAE